MKTRLTYKTKKEMKASPILITLAWIFVFIMVFFAGFLVGINYCYLYL